MSVLTKMPNYVRPFAYKQLAWISFFHGAPTFRCSLSITMEISGHLRLADVYGDGFRMPPGV
jgi:hypothetical protein